MKEQILETLRQQKHISGEELGKRLHISRNAVWKHINDLRRYGYKIDSSTKTGYSFVETTHLLIPEEIRYELKTQVIGKTIHYYNELGSTQDTAMDLARSGSAEGTIVISEMQTHGRGRKGRGWVSYPEGGIYISLILRPAIMPGSITQIPLVAGTAVVKAIHKLGPTEASLKWPNDVMIGNKKIGGILTEMYCEVETVDFVILGIGLNVNTPFRALSEQTGRVASSIAGEDTYTISRVNLVRNILEEFETLYLNYLESGFATIRDEWKSYCTTIGSQIAVRTDTEEITGQAIDIDNEGFLLVQKENGDIARVIGGDVA